MTKILFVNPKSIFRINVKPTIYPPLGLGYMATVLEKNGFDVKIYDFNVEDISYESFIKKYKPDFVGVTATTFLYNNARQTLKTTKKIIPETKTVLGGTHISALKNQTMEENISLDFGVYGEGELTILELLKNKNLENIKGLVYKKNSKIIVNTPRDLIKDLDSIPLPARHLLKMEKYKWPLTIITSRGCPYGCTFCTKSVFGRTWRGRSPKNVVDEIEFISDNYGHLSSTLSIVDDLFTLDLKRVRNICKMIIDRRLKIEFNIGAGGRVDNIDKKTLILLKKAGCNNIGFGIETLDEKILKNINKGITPNQVRNVIKMTKEIGIKANGLFMIGNQGETFEDSMITLNKIKKMKFDTFRVTQTVPFPGTPLYGWVKENGKFLTKRWSDFLESENEPVFETPEFTREQRILAYKKFYEYKKHLFFREAIKLIIQKKFIKILFRRLIIERKFKLIIKKIIETIKKSPLVSREIKKELN